MSVKIGTQIPNPLAPPPPPSPHGALLRLGVSGGTHNYIWGHAALHRVAHAHAHPHPRPRGRQYAYTHTHGGGGGVRGVAEVWDRGSAEQLMSVNWSTCYQRRSKGNRRRLEGNRRPLEGNRRPFGGD